METGADRFEKSAARWARDMAKNGRANPIPKGSLDDQALEGFKPTREQDALEHAGVRLLAGQRIRAIRGEASAVRDACESPIEFSMALALIVVARSRGANVKLVAHGREFGDRFELGGRWLDLDLGMELQAELGDHRVDFLLTLDGTLRHFGIHAASKRM
jgi:hypothetical protein